MRCVTAVRPRDSRGAHQPFATGRVIYGVSLYGRARSAWTASPRLPSANQGPSMNRPVLLASPIRVALLAAFAFTCLAGLACCQSPEERAMDRASRDMDRQMKAQVRMMKQMEKTMEEAEREMDKVD